MPVRQLLYAMLLAWALLATAESRACLNAIGTTHEGERFQDPFEHALLSMKRSDTRQIRTLRKITAEARTHPDLENLTDLAIALIYLDRTREAIHLLLAIEKKYPGHFETAGNLGTAYELAGDNDTALRWIRIGIRRNPDEHYGTEWLHARILEAKIAARSDPRWYATHSVAGVAFDPDVVPRVPTAMPNGNIGRPIAAWELNEALGYQLSERMLLVKAPDPVVANLLQDWATLQLAGGSVEDAATIYELAVAYGAPRTPLMAARKKEIQAIIARFGHRDQVPGARCPICGPPPKRPPPPSSVKPPG